MLYLYKFVLKNHRSWKREIAAVSWKEKIDYDQAPDITRCNENMAATYWHLNVQLTHKNYPYPNALNSSYSCTKKEIFLIQIYINLNYTTLIIILSPYMVYT